MPGKIEGYAALKTNDYNYPRIIPATRSAVPRVFIPVFPGTNCEYDMSLAFENAGAQAIVVPMKNRSSQDILTSLQEFERCIDNSQILSLAGGFSASDEPDGSGKFISIVLKNERIREAILRLLSRDGLIVGICNGFQALIKSGLLPYGKFGMMNADSPTLYRNAIMRHVSKIVTTKLVSNLSPWYHGVTLGTTYKIPISHGEGRFMADDKVISELIKNNQISTQYVDFEGNPTLDGDFNPNGSVFSIEGIVSPDGRILGKMGHSERLDKDLYKNIYNTNEEPIFGNGVKYFK
jgi:phosphoribosylformylglycinamidine synthase